MDVLWTTAQECCAAWEALSGGSDQAALPGGPIGHVSTEAAAQAVFAQLQEALQALFLAPDRSPKWLQPGGSAQVQFVAAGDLSHAGLQMAGDSLHRACSIASSHPTLLPQLVAGHFGLLFSALIDTLARLVSAAISGEGFGGGGRGKRCRDGS